MENQKLRTIKCPEKECGYENPKNRLTCEICGARLFPNFKGAEKNSRKRKVKSSVGH